MGVGKTNKRVGGEKVQSYNSRGTNTKQRGTAPGMKQYLNVKDKSAVFREAERTRIWRFSSHWYLRKSCFKPEPD